MAFFVMLLSGIAAVFASLVALLAYDVSWSYALGVYFVFATVPAAFFLAAVYINVLLSNSFDPERTLQDVQRTR